MRAIYLDILTTAKDEKRISYETIYQRTGISISKLQRIFTGQSSFSTDDFELICEKGLGLNLDDVYARFGRQEFRDSEQVDYKGAKELLSDFAKEKEIIQEQCQQRIQRERDAVDFLKNLLNESKEYNAKLTKRAIDAEKESSASRTTSRLVLLVSVVLIVVFAGMLVAGIVMDLPQFGMGNFAPDEWDTMIQELEMYRQLYGKV